MERIRHNPAVTTIQQLSQTRNARLPHQMLKHSSTDGTTNQRRPLTSKLSNTRVPHQTHRHWLKPSTIFSDVTRHKELHRFKLTIAKTCPYVTLRASSTSSQSSHLGTSTATDSIQNSGTRDPCCNVWKVAFVTQRQNWRRANTRRKVTKK